MPKHSSHPRWQKAVRYRWQCDECKETHEVAVIRRKGKADLRLCGSCFDDGFWKERP